jgi:hypothetical protein
MDLPQTDPPKEKPVASFLPLLPLLFSPWQPFLGPFLPQALPSAAPGNQDQKYGLKDVEMYDSAHHFTQSTSWASRIATSPYHRGISSDGFAGGSWVTYF